MVDLNRLAKFSGKKSGAWGSDYGTVGSARSLSVPGDLGSNPVVGNFY